MIKQIFNSLTIFLFLTSLPVYSQEKYILVNTLSWNVSFEKGVHRLKLPSQELTTYSLSNADCRFLIYKDIGPSLERYNLCDMNNGNIIYKEPCFSLPYKFGNYFVVHTYRCLNLWKIEDQEVRLIRKDTLDRTIPYLSCYLINEDIYVQVQDYDIISFSIFHSDGSQEPIDSLTFCANKIEPDGLPICDTNANKNLTLETDKGLRTFYQTMCGEKKPLDLYYLAGISEKSYIIRHFTDFTEQLLCLDKQSGICTDYEDAERQFLRDSIICKENGLHIKVSHPYVSIKKKYSKRSHRRRQPSRNKLSSEEAREDIMGIIKHATAYIGIADINRNIDGNECRTVVLKCMSLKLTIDKNLKLKQIDIISMSSHEEYEYFPYPWSSIQLQYIYQEIEKMAPRMNPGEYVFHIGDALGK